MLVILGFLAAILIAFVVAPAYRARTVRLATERLRRSIPISLEEIQADKDRLRADHAVRMHHVEKKVEQSRLSAAKQLIAINRRDARISALESDLASLNAAHEEMKNARSVLEQTVADRLPKVEHRLAEARKLLYQRDREIASVTAEAAKTSRALDDAIQINKQSRTEVERLTATLETRAARNRDNLSDPRFDGEVALRSEIEALRARNRDQAALLAKLQRAEAAGIATPLAQAQPRDAAAGGDDGQLRSELAAAESALRQAKEIAASGQAALEAEVRSHRAKVEDQASEIARLTAAVAAFEQAANTDRSISLKDSKIAIKAKLSSLQAQVDSQGQTIQRLRAEAAAANEKMARQAAHFMEEMRRLGAGTLPASASARRPGPNTGRRSLAERLSHAKPELANAIAAAPPRADNDTTAPPANGEAREGAVAADRASTVLASLAARNAPKKKRSAASDEAGAQAEPAAAAAAQVSSPQVSPPPAAAPAVRQRLADRLRNIGKD